MGSTSTRLLRAGVVVLALAAGCSWVELSKAGEGVRVVAAGEVADCRKLGKTTVTTGDHVWVFGRSATKVQEELDALARNEAADMGGNAVVATGDPEQGKQVFEIYSCSG